MPRALATDLLVFTLLVFMGIIQLRYYPHASDFIFDPGYPDLARSILDHGSYQFDYLPETTLPPGFPLILAAVGWFFGLSPAALFRVIAIFTTLGLIVVYLLFRRIEGRAAAAAACLLLGSSPSLFTFNTILVFPEMPYFFMSMVVLLLAVEIDRRNSNRTPIGWLLVLSIALVMAVLVRSVGITLLAGLGAWLAVSFFTAPEKTPPRLKRFWLPLLLGAAAQIGWSVWAQRHQVLEWQLPGYPESYTSQLRVKNGQYPELGLAHLSDIPARVGTNIVARTTLLAELLTQRHVSPFWSSPAIIGLWALIALGLWRSLRGGGQLYDWYFLCYEVTFWLWPWDTKARFLYPVVPLAFLYLWRGAKALGLIVIRKPKTIGRWTLVLAPLLSIISMAFASHIIHFNRDLNHARGDNRQPIAAAAFWAAVAMIGFKLIGNGSVLRLLEFTSERRSKVRLVAQAVGIVTLAALTGLGVEREIAFGRTNMTPDIASESSFPEIAASKWIQTDEPSESVIMARDQDMVFHYTNRRVVWFPPISNPDVLMNGIRRHGVKVIVVAHHPDSYWLPREDECFQSLLLAYVNSFRLVEHGRDYEIYEVTKP